MFKTEFSPKNIKQTSDKNKEKCKLGVISWSNTRRIMADSWGAGSEIFEVKGLI